MARVEQVLGTSSWRLGRIGNLEPPRTSSVPQRRAVAADVFAQHLRWSSGLSPALAIAGSKRLDTARSRINSRSRYSQLCFYLPCCRLAHEFSGTPVRRCPGTRCRGDIAWNANFRSAGDESD